MKLTLMIIFVLAVSGTAQKPEAVKVDEFGEVCSEDLMARLDGYFIQLHANPSAQGVVIFHGRADTEGRNIQLAHYISERYPNRPGAGEPPDLKLIRGENRQAQLIQFWLVPPGSVEPKPDAPYVPAAYDEATLYDRAWADFHRWSGPLDIYSDGFFDLGCDFKPNRGRLAQILKENRKIDAFLIVYTESKNPSRGVKIASFALNDLVRNFRIARSRVRGIYGGTRKEPEIEFWLVPRGQPRPKARPNLPPIRNF